MQVCKLASLTVRALFEPLPQPSWMQPVDAPSAAEPRDAQFVPEDAGRCDEGGLIRECLTKTTGLEARENCLHAHSRARGNQAKPLSVKCRAAELCWSEAAPSRTGLVTQTLVGGSRLEHPPDVRSGTLPDDASVRHQHLEHAPEEPGHFHPRRLDLLRKPVAPAACSTVTRRAAALQRAPPARRTTGSKGKGCRQSAQVGWQVRGVALLCACPPLNRERTILSRSATKGPQESLGHCTNKRRQKCPRLTSEG